MIKKDNKLMEKDDQINSKHLYERSHKMFQLENILILMLAFIRITANDQEIDWRELLEGTLSIKDPCINTVKNQLNLCIEISDG